MFTVSSLPEKWAAKIEEVPCLLLPELGPCWNWTGTLLPNNRGVLYGSIHLKRGPKGYKAAHRLIYEILVREIPDDLDLDHLCRNTVCVNPRHLEPVTRLENILRGLKFRKVLGVCIWGHERPPGEPCRKCAAVRDRRRRDKEKKIRAERIRNAVM